MMNMPQEGEAPPEKYPPRLRKNNGGVGGDFNSNNNHHTTGSIIQTLFCLTFLVLLCLAGYMQSLNGTFVFDDTVAIVKNRDVAALPTNLSAIFHNDFWGAQLRSDDSHKSYRPLLTLWFHAEYARWGLRAKHMKAVNLLLHCINTLLVWQLLRRLRTEQLELNTEKVATLAATLFAVHPVHTEAVCGVVGRADLIFCLLFLLALLLHSSESERTPALWADVLVIGLSALAMLFKETAVTIPLACVFFGYMRDNVYLVPWRCQLRLLLRSPRNLCYAGATTALVWLRFWLQNFESPRFKPMDNPLAFSGDLLTRILSQHYLYVVNVWILLCPQWLSFDWALGCVELVENISDLRLQAVLAFYSLIIVTITNFRRQFGLLLALGMLVIPFLPASGIIRVGFVIAERVLYAPSVGFCFMCGYAFVYSYSIASHKWLRAALQCSLMFTIVCLLLRTRERANEWQTEEKLFASALKVCPKNAKVHYNIARLATDKLERGKAFQHYHRAIELYPQYEAALMNLGNLYREAGDLPSAERYIEAALEALHEFPAAWMNLGIVQSARKKFTDARQSYETALKYRPNYAICHYNMGNLFLDQKLYTQAMQHWQEAVALNPRQPKAWANILTMLDNRGLHEDALLLSERALAHLPNETSILFIRANVFGKLKHYVEAELLYKRVIETEPLNVLYHTNLGVLYHRWDKLNAAIDSYQRALKLNPERANTARENLSKLFRRKRQEELLVRDAGV